MQALQQAIQQKSSFMASLFLADYYKNNIDMGRYLVQIEALMNNGIKKIDPAASKDVQLQQLIRYFYIDLAFSGDDSQIFAQSYNFIDKVLDYRTGTPMILAILFCQIGNAAGIKCREIAFPGHYLVRVELAQGRYCFLEPSTGSQLHWQALLAFYRTLSGDTTAEMIPDSVLQPATCQDIMVRMLHNIKGSFIETEEYTAALHCTELLLTLCPDDPYERRDRGFLLHQMGIEHLAMTDYNYFLDQCPDDPICELLKQHMLAMGQVRVTWH